MDKLTLYKEGGKPREYLLNNQINQSITEKIVNDILNVMDYDWFEIIKMF